MTSGAQVALIRVWKDERESLAASLQTMEAGDLHTLEGAKDTTPASIAEVKRRIAELDELIAEAGGDNA